VGAGHALPPFLARKGARGLVVRLRRIQQSVRRCNAMKMEVVNLSSTEQRVLLLFDGDGLSQKDEQADTYLHDHELEPKRQYRETRDGKEYLVYYFGHCYLEGHLDQLSAFASEAPLQESQKPGADDPAMGKTHAH
jgi:hypothetical protein